MPIRISNAFQNKVQNGFHIHFSNLACVLWFSHEVQCPRHSYSVIIISEMTNSIPNCSKPGEVRLYDSIVSLIIRSWLKLKRLICFPSGTVADVFQLAACRIYQVRCLSTDRQSQ